MNEENEKQKPKKIKFRSAESGHEGGGEEHYQGFKAGANQNEPNTHEESSDRLYRSDSGHQGGGGEYYKALETAADKPKRSALAQFEKASGPSELDRLKKKRSDD